MWNIFGKKPREGTEARHIHDEVQKKKKRAKDREVDKLISSLYFSEIQYFPSWIDHSRYAVPNEITQTIKSTSEKEDVEEVIEIDLFGEKYKFEFGSKSFSLPDGDYATHGNLTLYENDKKVLTLNCSMDYDEIDSEWRPFDIEAYIEGDWIDNFEKLKTSIQKNKEKREIQEVEDPDLLKKMKDNFGID